MEKETRNQNVLETNLEIKNEDIFLEESYKCIISIVSRGYAREVIRASKEAGAKGAVIMQGRGVGQSERKFFGADIEPENEVVLILTPEKIALPVMKEIYTAVDYKGPGRGLVFALPVNYISGMINAKDLFDY